MDRIMLANHIAELRNAFLADVLPHARDQYEEKAFSSISKRLEAMEQECRTGRLSPRQERYGYIAKMVVESDPKLLPPEFGGELIEAEKAYRSL